MSIEQEIKLTLPVEAADQALADLSNLFGAPNNTDILENHYFDTPEGQLAQTKIALRLRRTNKRWLQTLKTSGTVQHGIHAREEWEMPIAQPKIDLLRLKEHCPNTALMQLIEQAIPRLECIFQTNFKRYYWLIEKEGTCLEIALDIGKIILSDLTSPQSEPIAEVEIELKSGNINELHRITQALNVTMPYLSISSISKAQRGYQLYFSQYYGNAHPTID